MKIGIETESFHLFFQYGKMNILDFIRKAAEIGFEGVELNMIPGWGIEKSLGQMGDDTVENLDAIRDEIKKYGLYAEIDTNGTSEADLKKALRVANHIGANVIRTYIRFNKFDAKAYKQTTEDLKNIVPELKKYRIKIALENHEYETSEELVKIIKEVNSVWVGLHYDFGNSMMVWEDPVKAAKNMAPYTYTTHFKDHIIVEEPETEYGYLVCGVPAGTGNIDLEECFKIMVENSPLERINMEMCFPYCTTFKREPGTGGVEKVGKGAFKVEKAPYDRNIIKPLDYYFPHKVVSDEIIEKMMEDQLKGAEIGYKYLSSLRDKYCSKK
ncbi:sugar phosphate isomerase/epimerase family protein [uncultured Fusobacterium sp.]|uniref:sugar phosphate isomerase/epimerase family protein n=1 Tax=uncultured Fusobacterium sp. TaxID=159267 RepID=UPI0025DF0C64|nr:sugar phosphate isomerase/epimerase family protein [uncultured Fusobacterium sp.]